MADDDSYHETTFDEGRDGEPTDNELYRLERRKWRGALIGGIILVIAGIVILIAFGRFSFALLAGGVFLVALGWRNLSSLARRTEEASHSPRPNHGENAPAQPDHADARPSCPKSP